VKIYRDNKDKERDVLLWGDEVGIGFGKANLLRLNTW
jgi:hypothetical protein